jgi:hypothetical protein
MAAQMVHRSGDLLFRNIRIWPGENVARFLARGFQQVAIT